MATKLTKDYLRGIMVSETITPDDFDSSNATGYSTFETIPDQPTPNPASKMVLNSSGECLQSTDIEVVTFKSGVSSTARYAIRDNTISLTESYGHNPPNTIQDFELLSYSASPALSKASNPDILVLDDGSYISVYDHTNVLTSTREIQSVHVSKTNVKTFSTVQTLTTTSTEAGFPSICILADNSILCSFFFIEGDYLNLSLYRSTDNGSNWILINDQALDEFIDVGTSKYTIQKARLRALGGQVLLIIGAYFTGSATYKNQILQYASVDGGCNFNLVTTAADSKPFNRPELFIHDNQFSIAYVTTNKIYYLILPHAFYPVQALVTAGKYITIATGTANQFGAGSDTNITSGDICACSNSNNHINVYFDDISLNATNQYYSEDGINFRKQLNARLFFIDTTTKIEHYSVAELDSRFVLVHSWEGGPATNENSISALYLGGFSNHDYPYLDTHPSAFDSNRTQFNKTYLPYEKTQDCSIFSVTGTYTEVLSSGENKITVNNNTYTATITNTIDIQYGTTIRGVVKVDSGSTLTVELIHDDGSTKHRVSVTFTGTNITDVASTNTVSHDCTVPVEFIFYQRLSVEKFYFRTHSISNVKKFTQLNVANTTHASTGTFNHASLSITDSSATNRSFYLYQFMTSNLNISGNFEFETINEGRRFPAPTYSQYLDAGIRISALGGPTYKDNQWNIKALGPYSINNALFSVSPSPRVVFRSAEVTSGSVSQMKIPFNLSTNDSYFSNDLIAVHLKNINFEEFKIQKYTSSSWVDYGTFNSSNGMEHACKIRGKTLAPNTSGVSTNNNYYFYNELKNNIVKVTSTSGTEYRRIVSNSEGVFGTSTSKPCIITLESDLSTADLTGTFKILATDVLVLINLNQISGPNTLKKIAIQISTQETIDNFFQIGSVNFGPVAITGQQYSKGRRITIQAGTIQNIQNDGTLYSRNVAPDQRTVQISWSDGVDISTLYNSNPDPDYYGSSNAVSPEPVSVYKDAPYLIEGVLREVKGSNKPLVYLPSIESGFDTKILNRRHDFLYSYLNSEVQIESVTGEELVGNGQGEVMRIANIDLVEIV